ncbi:MAG: YidC/Oxa1 family membrane protein insertase [Lachnospiraceae bacterium]|nr:YidC/Oxa1 family membrane protein insertase [Lachnospiraceae bacterium]
MDFMLLTQVTGILKPFAWILGNILNGIFWVLDKITGGNPNTGVAIILFTVVVNCLMIPLTVKQQKFSKFTAKMNPELQAIQNKYKGKNDQDSIMKMQAETQFVYSKYGVSPTGSCVQLLIQFPILISLYRVIYNMPAYVAKIKEAFMPLVSKFIYKEGSVEFLQSCQSYNYYKKQFSNELFGVTQIDSGIEYTQNTYIDVLNRASTGEWNSLKEQFPDLINEATTATDLLENYNQFLMIDNISNSPSFIINTAWNADERNWILIIGAIMIPVLSALTQWINTKLMPQQQNNNKKNDGMEDPMVASMKTMNNLMPIMSAFFCYTMPAGMGIYWITGSVVRGVIQVCVNKYLDKIDIDEMIKKNIEKNNELRAKQGLPPQQINQNATKNTRNLENKAENKSSEKKVDNTKQIKDSTEYYKKLNNAKEGSLASKVNMVKQYNERGNAKDKEE